MTGMLGEGARRQRGERAGKGAAGRLSEGARRQRGDCACDGVAERRRGAARICLDGLVARDTMKGAIYRTLL